MGSHHPTSISTNLNGIRVVLVIAGVTSLVLYRVGLRAEGTKDMLWFLKLVACQATLYFVACWIFAGLCKGTRPGKRRAVLYPERGA